ncbi:hypothetical protein JMM63_04355 [Rhodovulum sulfidophilum]|uniref:Uncharacterized protein n=1 Tax=Rhodovulum sulfidophilum TaxID=35806 RepID=A0ABS1RQ68_RHOSU|nr:hypothetical protein [Rhodovulum sulfidophilum]MBL3594807.1 hypothetical protein [Rhodovulum sulfidophilum]MBL3608211.1 hypothetical protein [Rhodovulum sulfidophilum]MCE8456308.1 hypothetical protein [Rhodovulum sulfidophilum]
MPKFRVLRQHLGERMYREGEMRDAAASEVAHLVAAGVLEPVAPEIIPAPDPKRRRARKETGE